MASENDIVITARMDSDSATTGVDDLFAKIEQMRSQLEGMAAGGGVDDFSAKLEDVKSHVDSVGMSVQTWHQIAKVAGDIFNAELDDIMHAADKTAEAWEKATDTISKYQAEREKAAKSGSMKDQLGGNKQYEDALSELGYGALGFSAGNTIAGRMERFGSRVSDFFSGDDTGAAARREGVNAANRNAEIQQNNKEEQSRRDFQMKADEDRWKQNNKNASDYFKEQHKLDEEEAKEADKMAMDRGRAILAAHEEVARDEEKRARQAQQFERQEEMRALNEPMASRDKGFRSGIESLEATYNRIASGAASDRSDPAAEAKAQREDLFRRQQALREKWRQEDEAKAKEHSDYLANKLKELMGAI